ncbi:MAG TPA: Uma2 family endonuclease, partial [Aggregatilineales bacterium]|nr:Uma2 family endonuclease [Aggregatilineales bacterium]
DQTLTSVITAAQVAEREAEEEFSREIVGGKWIEEQELPGEMHTGLVKRVTWILDVFVVQNNLGEVYPDGAIYVLEGTPEHIITQRVPDVSFLSKAKANPSNTGYIYHAPDLAIEILSPTERPGHTAAKIADYLGAGTKQVWVIDPEGKNIAVHFPDGRVKVYDHDETLPGGELLPDFVLNVTDVFA